MKNLITLLFVFLVLGCASDDDTQINQNQNSDSPPQLTITVEPPFDDSPIATIRWEYTGTGNTIYRIVILDEVVAENYTENSYSLEIENKHAYSGTIFAISQDGDETFKNFYFTLEDHDTWFGDYYVYPESGPVPYKYITGTLTVPLQETYIEKISEVEKVLGLEIVGGNRSSLEGMEHIDFYYASGAIEIRNSDNLSDVTGISHLKEKTISLSVENCQSLTNLQGLGVQEGGSIYLENIPIADFSTLTAPSQLQNLEIKTLDNINDLSGLENVTEIVDVLSITNSSCSTLDGLNNLTSMHSINLNDLQNLSSLEALGNATKNGGLLMLVSLPNLTSLNGLEGVREFDSVFRLLNLTNLSNIDALAGLEFCRPGDVFYFWISNCYALSDLSGLDNLIYQPVTEETVNLDFNLYSNTMLGDFCGLRNFTLSIPMETTNIDWDTMNNLWNPSFSQVQSGQCSL